MRYLLFKGACSDCGADDFVGTDDLIGGYDTVAAALADMLKQKSRDERAHVVDLQTLKQADVEWDAATRSWKVGGEWLAKA